MSTISPTMSLSVEACLSSMSTRVPFITSCTAPARSATLPALRVKAASPSLVLAHTVSWLTLSTYLLMLLFFSGVSFGLVRLLPLTSVNTLSRCIGVVVGGACLWLGSPSSSPSTEKELLVGIGPFGPPPTGDLIIVALMPKMPTYT